MLAVEESHAEPELSRQRARDAFLKRPDERALFGLAQRLVTGKAEGDHGAPAELPRESARDSRNAEAK